MGSIGIKAGLEVKKQEIDIGKPLFSIIALGKKPVCSLLLILIDKEF